MKTTLIIDDRLMRRVRREAARRDWNLSEVVEAALRLLLDSEGMARQVKPLPRLPRFNLGGSRVNLADRNALDEVMGR